MSDFAQNGEDIGLGAPRVLRRTVERHGGAFTHPSSRQRGRFGSANSGIDEHVTKTVNGPFIFSRAGGKGRTPTTNFRNLSLKQRRTCGRRIVNPKLLKPVRCGLRKQPLEKMQATHHQVTKKLDHKVQPIDGSDDEDEPFYADDFESESPRPCVGACHQDLAVDGAVEGQKVTPAAHTMSPSQAAIHAMHARLGLPKDLRYAVNLSKKALPVILFQSINMETYKKFGQKARKRSELVAMMKGEFVPTSSPSATLKSPEAKSPKRSSIRSHVPTCACETCRHERRRPNKLPTRLGFRVLGSEIKLIISILQSHGFLSCRKWNVLWTSQHLKSYFYQGLNKHQRVNQFPRSYEITRKDTLCRNINRMKALHGERNYGFVPEGWVLPAESDVFQRFYEQNGSGNVYIVKPAALSCGRGIYLTDDINDIQLHGLDDNVQVSQYISNPLLVDGYKVDLRMYVGITSFNPLTIYVHDAGLARFCTEKYSSDPKNYDNKFMHLTNFSINKLSDKFVSNDDEANDDMGQKWSLAAFKRRLVHDLGEAAVRQAFKSVNDIFIKTFISIEAQVNSAMKMFVPHTDNCFQLFGFDIMLDDNLRPWLIEINFAPSLACPSPLDLDLKSQVVSDLLNLSGVQPFDEGKMSAIKLGLGKQKQKNGGKKLSGKAVRDKGLPAPGSNGSSRLDGYPMEAKRSILSIEAADKRCGGFTRVFPNEDALKYRNLFEEPTPINDCVGEYFATRSTLARSPSHGAARRRF